MTWIKMRGNLWDDPRVSRLCDLTGQGEAAIVGGLYWLWNTADQHTEDGILPGLTAGAIDRKSGVPGLAAGLVAIGWLADHPEGVRVVNFEEHNGASAKRRSEDAKRKAGVRKDADKARTEPGRAAESFGKPAELEKRREDKKEERERATRLPPGFEPSPEPEAEQGIDRRTELANFRDYWTAKPGKDGLKLDWQATWRTWARKAHRKPADIARQTVPSDPAAIFQPEPALTADQLAANRARAQQALEALGHRKH